MDTEIRLRQERLERELLSPRAAKSADSKGRLRTEEKCPLRTEFQRDRDRIIHCKSFRRLKHKTQVFLSPEGDHYRTRLTHTLEVAQIARTVARALRLNEDLTEAVALGHDLGHTPFGHAGERALNACVPGGFRHYRQSLRVADVLEKDGRGLNLTAEVRDGILCHTDADAQTLEGRIVRWADRIAYMNHDIDDAVRAGVLGESDIPPRVREIFGDSKTKRIHSMVTAVIAHGDEDIGLDSEHRAAFDELHAFLFEAVYRNPKAKGEEGKAEGMICKLYEYFCKHAEKLPEEFRRIRETEGPDRAAADFVAGMTDRYAIHAFEDLFLPKVWQL